MGNGRLRWVLLGALAAGVADRAFPAPATPPAGPVAAQATIWNFDNAQQPFAGTGPARLRYRDPGHTGWGPASTTFATARAVGLPLIDGKDTGVMGFPATAPDQGYTLIHGSAPNGVFADAGDVSNYTLVMDLLWPAGKASTHRSLFQTDARNADDGEMFFKDLGRGKLGLGVNSFYNSYGAVTPGTWHRVAIAVQCALGAGGTGQMHKYIDGLFVGGYDTPEQKAGDTRCRWALGPELHLFADDDGETAAGYVASILYVNRLMFPEEIKALGRPHAAGANVPGPAARPIPQRAKRRVRVIAHRTQTGRMPENTLAGLRDAFERGADHVEVDVRKTRDGTLVLMHDPTVDRTTNGSGRVADLKLGALRRLDAGSWFDPIYAGERVPTLVEALTVAKGKGRLLLDVKEMGLGRAIQHALDKAGVAADAIWPSLGTSREAAADFTAHLPGAGILWGAPPESLTPAGFADLRRLGVVGFDLHHSLVTPEFVKAARANDMFIVAYTILDPDTMLRLIDLGVDGMETDFPAVLDELMPPRPKAPRAPPPPWGSG